jgi:glutathione peroxidase
MDQVPPSIYDFSATLLNGQPVGLAQFRGRVLLIVNTASRCGFTPQFAGLETLYRTYHSRGFEVLGFPSNQFGAQEPGSEDEIGTFCRENYQVTFHLFAKICVNGPQAHPLYRFLRNEKPGLLPMFGSGAIRWNFTKFLVGRNGSVVARFSPGKKPASMASAIERLLDESHGPPQA